MLILIATTSAWAQEDQIANDTIIDRQVLEEVIVSAYSYQRPWLKAAASIGQVSTQDFSHFSDASMLSAMNTIAAVRMEER